MSPRNWFVICSARKRFPANISVFKHKYDSDEFVMRHCTVAWKIMLKDVNDTVSHHKFITIIFVFKNRNICRKLVLHIWLLMLVTPGKMKSMNSMKSVTSTDSFEGSSALLYLFMQPSTLAWNLGDRLEKSRNSEGVVMCPSKLYIL